MKKYRSSKSKRRQADLLDLFFETVISCTAGLWLSVD